MSITRYLRVAADEMTTKYRKPDEYGVHMSPEAEKANLAAFFRQLDENRSAREVADRKVEDDRATKDVESRRLKGVEDRLRLAQEKMVEQQAVVAELKQALDAEKKAREAFRLQVIEDGKRRRVTRDRAASVREKQRQKDSENRLRKAEECVAAQQAIIEKLQQSVEARSVVPDGPSTPKLTRLEAEIADIIKARPGVCNPEIAQELGMTEGHIRKQMVQDSSLWLLGYRRREKHYGYYPPE